MSEHVFPYERRWRGRNLLDTAVLHHLLTRHPRRTTAERLARELAGRTPTRAEAHAVRRSLTRLSHAGLVDLTATTAEPSRPARRFHDLMLGGVDGRSGP